MHFSCTTWNMKQFIQPTGHCSKISLGVGGCQGSSCCASAVLLSVHSAQQTHSWELYLCCSTLQRLLLYHVRSTDMARAHPTVSLVRLNNLTLHVYWGKLLNIWRISRSKLHRTKVEARSWLLQEHLKKKIKKKSTSQLLKKKIC